MAPTVRPSDSAAVSNPRSPVTRTKAAVLFVVIHDALLLNVLAGLTTDEIREALQESGVFTTGCWYYRLSRPVHGDEVTGSLSLQLGGPEIDLPVRVVAALDHLRDSIGLLSLRDLVAVMQALRVSRPLDMLNAAALAAHSCSMLISWCAPTVPCWGGSGGVWGGGVLAALEVGGPGRNRAGERTPAEPTGP